MESARLVLSVCYLDDRAKDIKSTQSLFLISRHHASEFQEKQLGRHVFLKKKSRRAPLPKSRPGVTLLRMSANRKLGDVHRPVLLIRRQLASSHQSSSTASLLPTTSCHLLQTRVAFKSAGPGWVCFPGSRMKCLRDLLFLQQLKHSQRPSSTEGRMADV